MYRPFHCLLATCGLALVAGLAGCGTAPGADMPTPAPERRSGPQPLYASSRVGAEAALAIERVMDNADKLKLAHVLELTSNATVTWRNAATGREFTLTPLRMYAGEYGTCREFSVDVAAQGSIDRMRGSACPGADNRWRVQH